MWFWKNACCLCWFFSVSHFATDEHKQTGYITVGYRGTFAFGRDGLSDVKFRKLARIIVCGRVALCREVRDKENYSIKFHSNFLFKYSTHVFMLPCHSKTKIKPIVIIFLANTHAYKLETFREMDENDKIKPT